MPVKALRQSSWYLTHLIKFRVYLLGKEDIGQIWRGNSEHKKVGEEGNETGTHNASKSDHVEW